MAVEAERLLAVFEARFTQLEKALDKARSNSSKTFSSMEKDGSRAETALANVGKTAQRTASVLDQVNKSLRIDTGGFGDRGADVAAYAEELDNLRARFNPLFAASRQYERELDELNRALSVGAVNATEHASALDRLNGRYAALRGQATSATAVMSSARFETANVAAQFQDIAVTLAAGQSPFLIALQQGTQLTQVLGPAGLRGTVSLLGGAFASLVSPVSLVTLGLIAAGGYAVQYFASVMNNAGPAEASLKEQANLIQRVADRWGEALPALRAYADELKRQQEEAERTEGIQTAINSKWQETRQILPDVQSALGDVISQMVRANASSADIQAVRDAFYETSRAAQDLSTKQREGSAVTADYERLARAVAQLQQNEVVSGFESAAEAVERLGRVTLATAKATKTLAEEQARLQAGPIGGETVAGGKTTRRVLSDEDFAARFGWDEYFNFPSDPGGSSSRGSSVDDVDREREAVEQLIAELEFERSLIGSTAVEREKANALRRAGAAATDEERQYLEVLIEATHQQREGIEASEQAYRNLEQAGRTALNGIISAFADGKIEAQEMLSIVGSLASQLFSMRRGGGGGGGNWLSLLFGGFRANTSYGQFIGANANGTDYWRGGPTWVGEKGPEIVNLPRGSQVIPNHKAGGVSAVVNFSPMIDNRGASTEAVARTEAALAKLKAELPSHVIKAVREAKSGRVSF